MVAFLGVLILSITPVYILETFLELDLSVNATRTTICQYAVVYDFLY